MTQAAEGGKDKMMAEQARTEGRMMSNKGLREKIRYEQFYVPFTHEMRSAIEEYWRAEGCFSFNEAAVELMLLGLDREKREGKRGQRAEYLPEYSAAMRQTIRMTEAAFEDFETWRYANRLDLKGRAVMILVQKGLEEVGRG
jgi:hypothetical protein